VHFVHHPNNYIFICTVQISHVLATSSRHTLAILDRFKVSRGYMFLERLLSNSRNNSLYVNIIINVVIDLMPLGPEYLKATGDNITVARNFEAFDVILSAFTPYIGPLPPPVTSGVYRSQVKSTSKDKSTELFLSELIHGIMGLLAANKANFEVLESKYMLIGTLLKNIPYLVTTSLPDISIKTIEFVATALDVVPLEIVHVFPQLLSSLTHLDSVYDKKHQYLVVRVHETLKTLISFKASYKQLLRESGLLEHLVKVFDQIYAIGEHDTPENIIPGQEDSLTLIYRDQTCALCTDLLVTLLKESGSNEAVFRDINGLDVVFNLLCQDDETGQIRADMIKILMTLAISDTLQEEDVARILEIFQTSAGKPELQCCMLGCLADLMNANGQVQRMFRQFQGFEALLGSLASLDNAFSVDSFKDNEELVDELSVRLSGEVIMTSNAQSAAQHGKETTVKGTDEIIFTKNEEKVS
jgi:hypothetical protein